MIKPDERELLLALAHSEPGAWVLAPMAHWLGIPEKRRRALGMKYEARDWLYDSGHRPELGTTAEERHDIVIDFVAKHAGYGPANLAPVLPRERRKVDPEHETFLERYARMALEDFHRQLADFILYGAPR